MVHCGLFLIPFFYLPHSNYVEVHRAKRHKGTWDLHRRNNNEESWSSNLRKPLPPIECKGARKLHHDGQKLGWANKMGFAVVFVQGLIVDLFFEQHVRGLRINR
jgi:hypothetical protein